jgi:hypothetical protein
MSTKWLYRQAILTTHTASSPMQLHPRFNPAYFPRTIHVPSQLEVQASTQPQRECVHEIAG